MRLNIFKKKNFKEDNSAKKSNYWIENFKTFSIAILIALTLRTFAFEPLVFPQVQ